MHKTQLDCHFIFQICTSTDVEDSPLSGNWIEIKPPAFRLFPRPLAVRKILTEYWNLSSLPDNFAYLGGSQPSFWQSFCRTALGIFLESPCEQENVSDSVAQQTRASH